MSTSSSPTTRDGDSFVCEYEKSNRSSCGGEGFYKEHDGKRYCVLHYPGAEKKEAFAEALQRKLDDNDFNFRGVWFPDDVSFYGFKFGAVADFSGAYFSAEADFSRAQFITGAYFSRAQFRAGAHFSRTKFSADAFFSDAQFRANADFSGAKFSAKANFFRAPFSANANFFGAQFSLAAEFSNAQFSAEADFSNAQFSAGASFLPRFLMQLSISRERGSSKKMTPAGKMQSMLLRQAAQAMRSRRKLNRLKLFLTGQVSKMASALKRMY
jgi:hypothetical protein